MKNIFTLSALTALLLFSGCGNEEANCRIEIQKAIDEGNFESAISKLDGSCKTALNENDRLYSLATAYMGKSGYGVSDVIKMVVEADDNDSGGAFATFTKSVAKNRKSDSISLLEKSKSLFLRSLEPSSSDVAALYNKYCSLRSSYDDPRIKNACFYVGFSDVMRTSVTVSNLTKNVNVLVDAIDEGDASKVPLDMKVSLDALAWAIGQQPQNGSQITSQAVTQIKGGSYVPLVITNNGETFYRLADKDAPSSRSSTIVTEGYCDADGNMTACDGIEKEDGSIDTSKIPSGTTCYACPVTADGQTATKVVGVLVEALNEGVDTIVAVANDPDVEDSVKKFKKEVTGSENGTVTVDDIMKYLNAKQN